MDWTYTELPRLTVEQLRDKGLDLARAGEIVGAKATVHEIRRRVDEYVSQTGMSTPALARADRLANEIVAEIRRQERKAR